MSEILTRLRRAARYTHHNYHNYSSQATNCPSRARPPRENPARIICDTLSYNVVTNKTDRSVHRFLDTRELSCGILSNGLQTTKWVILHWYRAWCEGEVRTTVSTDSDYYTCTRALPCPVVSVHLDATRPLVQVSVSGVCTGLVRLLSENEKS